MYLNIINIIEQTAKTPRESNEEETTILTVFEAIMLTNLITL